MLLEGRIGVDIRRSSRLSEKERKKRDSELQEKSIRFIDPVPTTNGSEVEIVYDADTWKIVAGWLKHVCEDLSPRTY